jgi:hypothetical protein
MKETDYSNPMEWEERLFFTEMRDTDISDMTSGEFRAPGKPNGTHPIFLLQLIGRGVFRFCPCSTKEYNGNRASYIRGTARTTPHGLRVESDSYILHFFPFNLTYSSPLVDRLPLLGRVDESDIVGDFHKERSGR